MSLRILLVEDDEYAVELVQRALVVAGLDAEVQVETRGDAAQRTLQRMAGGRMPDVVLLDLRLDGMTGVELLRWMRATPGLESCRVVLYTGSVLPSDEAGAWAAGADDFFVKPDRFDQLVERMRGLPGVRGGAGGLSRRGPRATPPGRPGRGRGPAAALY